MKKRTWFVGVAALLAVAERLRLPGMARPRSAPPRRRRAPANAPFRSPSRWPKSARFRSGSRRSAPSPPMASVAIKSRVDTEIVGVHFADGARVKQGDSPVHARQPPDRGADKRVQARDRRRQGAARAGERDIARYTELVAKNATAGHPRQRQDPGRRLARARPIPTRRCSRTSRCSSAISTIRAPISGRISTATVKVGNFVRSADAVPLATINQTAPIYVSFRCRSAAARRARGDRGRDRDVEAVIPGEPRRASGRVDDDREHGRCRDRHGQRARHHAEQGRDAVARHAGATRI